MIQDAAYDGLLKSTRRELHRRVAQTLTERFPALAEAQPQILARHWSDAGEAEPAVAAWTKAARAARARHAFKEAEEGYRQSLAMLGTLPGSRERDARELKLAGAFYSVLCVTKGYASPEAVEVVARARALAEEGGNLPELVLSISIAVVSAWISGDYVRALSLADQLLDVARREGSDSSLRVAHLNQFFVRFYRGDLVGADEHFALWTGIGEASGYRQGSAAETTNGMGNGGLCAWVLGQAAAACERIARAKAFARETKSPYDLAYGLTWESLLSALRREPERAEAAAVEALAICAEHRFPQIGGVAWGSLGWARAQLGSAGEGVALIRQGIAGLVDIGQRVAITLLFVWLAEAQALDRAIADAFATIEDALTANPEELVYRPLSLIGRGDLRLTLGQTDVAEADFREAIALARTMRAKAWELRAATHLARLLRDTGRRDESHILLAEIYGWFAEGFDTRDLQDAKALLDGL